MKAEQSVRIVLMRHGQPDVALTSRLRAAELAGLADLAHATGEMLLVGHGVMNYLIAR